MSKKTIEEIIEYANWLIESQADRVKMQQQMRSVYRLDWQFAYAKEPGNEWVVPVVDPLPNNAIRTMANILANRFPRVKVKIPREAIEQSVVDRSSAWAVAAWRRLPLPIRKLASPKMPIEKMQEVYENVIRYTLRQNDERRDGALRRDAAIDGFVYDQIAFKCVDLRLTRLWGGDGVGANRRARLNGESPFIIKRIDPTALYTERDDFGVSVAIHRYLRSLREVKAVYRDKIRGDLDALKDEKNFVLFTEKWWRDGDGKYWKAAWIEKIASAYTDMDDQIQRIAWIVDEDGNEIQENSLGFIPIISKTCNGNGNDIMPTLYAAVHSGMHIASNIAWTYRASLPIKFANPQWQLEGWVDGQPMPKLDYTAMRIIPVRQGQRLTPLDEPHNSEIPALVQATEHKMQESLISETMLGRYPTGAPASAFALATSTGAQIIEPVREALKYAFSQAARLEFEYLKVYPTYDSESDGKLTLWIDGGETVVDPHSIPAWLDIEVEFEPDLPQDKIALMNIAMQAYAMQWLPRDKTYEIARLEDINEINRMWEEENPKSQDPKNPNPNNQYQESKGLPAQALQPNVQEGFPVELNPHRKSSPHSNPGEIGWKRLGNDLRPPDQQEQAVNGLVAGIAGAQRQRKGVR